ncbi:MAG: hypothetical protein PHW62_07240 [Candidatus Ratteibacteria bacterium]|nr:hypothetical protein [Candidatus Ratteibacteria bacterium]
MLNDKPLLNEVTAFFLFLIFILIPIYILPSGNFQLVDISIILLAISLIFALKKTEINFMEPAVKTFALYVAWAVSLNLVYFLLNGHIFLLKVSVQIIYTFTLFFIFVIVFYRVLLYKYGIQIISLCLLAALFSPFLTRGTYDFPGQQLSLLQRNALSFNNPNQLAYFAILLYAMSIILRKYILESNYVKSQNTLTGLINFFIFLFSHFFVLYSASRSGIIGILLLDIVAIWQYKKILIPFSLCILASVIIIQTGIYYEADFSNIRMVQKFTDYGIEESLSKRIDERFFQNLPTETSVIIGTGKTIPDGSHKEVHNGFIDIFLSYGAVGLLLFLLFLVSLIIKTDFKNGWRKNIYYMFVLLPIFAYNFVHNGFRFRFFWVFLAFWYVIMGKTVENKKASGVPGKNIESL